MSFSTRAGEGGGEFVSQYADHACLAMMTAGVATFQQQLRIGSGGSSIDAAGLLGGAVTLARWHLNPFLRKCCGLLLFSWLYVRRIT